MSEILVRRATAADRDALFAVEALSTPGLRYLPHVFNQFLTDPNGAFLVAEMAGEVVACGKFTVVPDGSAWLETLRVIPARQRLGIGKRLYTHFFATAREQEIHTLRMYTGTKNLVSKGLAERFGFRLAESFAGWQWPCSASPHPVSPASALAFEVVTDPATATTLVLKESTAWHDFLVMNRTFYKLTPALCNHLTRLGQIYHEPASNSVIVMGARFMPEQALHVGLFGGDAARALQFAQQQGQQRGVPQISCLLPTAATDPQHALEDAGFTDAASTLIVMEHRRSGRCETH